VSPVLATLTFGLTARHKRVAFSRTERNFGGIGELLTVLLFVFAVTTLEWERVVDGAGLAAVLLLARFVVKAERGRVRARQRHHLAQGTVDRYRAVADVGVRHAAAGADEIHGHRAGG
jgi:hypothetical protein